MSQQKRTGQDYLKNLFYPKNLLCRKRLPWFFLSLDVSNLYLFLTSLHFQQYSPYRIINITYRIGEAFVYEK